MSDVHQRILAWLEEQQASFRKVHHPPTFTSEESAAARGESLEVGGKALLLKCGQGPFKLFVMSAALRLDSAAVRRALGVNKVRFATAEELLELTGLVPGSVPPFGPPILPFELHADPSVLAQERIAFNAGSLTDSVVMASADWQRIAAPKVFSFTAPTS